MTSISILIIYQFQGTQQLRIKILFTSWTRLKIGRLLRIYGLNRKRKEIRKKSKYNVRGAILIEIERYHRLIFFIIFRK